MQKLLVVVSSMNYDADSRQNIVYPVLFSSAQALKEKMDELVAIRVANLKKAHEIYENVINPLIEKNQELMDSDDFENPAFQELHNQLEPLLKEQEQLTVSTVYINCSEVNLYEIVYAAQQAPAPFNVYTLDEWFDRTLESFKVTNSSE